MPKSTKKNNNNKIKNTDEDDFKIIEEFAELNRKEALLINKKNISDCDKGVTPLSQKLDQLKKNNLKNKIKNAITDKNLERNILSRKEKEEKEKETQKQEQEIRNILNHPQITKEIIELYLSAIEYSPKQNIPQPIEIFDNTEYYKKEYYQYIISILNVIKEQKLNINSLNRMLDNPYGKYMSKCLNCPLNPFNKINQI